MQDVFSVAPNPRIENIPSFLAEVLELLAEAAGMEFDPILAQKAIQQVETEIEGPLEQTWQPRLVQAGRELGLRVSEWSGSLRQAADLACREGPVLIQGSGEGWAPFFLVVESLGRKCRFIEFPGAAERWLPLKEAAAALGLDHPEQRVRGLLGQPLLPCDALQGRGHGTGNGHGHGHGGGSDDHDGGHSISPLRRLVGLLRSERRDLRLVILFAIGIGILTLATPIAVEALVTNVAFGGAFLQPVLVLSLVLFAFLGVAAAIRMLKNYVVEVMQQRIFIRVVSDLAYRLPRVHVSAFDRGHGPEMVNRFFEVLTVQKAGSTLLLDGLSVVLQAGIGLIVLAVYHPLLLGFDILLLGAVAFIVFGLGRGAVDTSIEESKAKYAMAGWLEEVARHPLAFKLSGGPEYALTRADHLARIYLAQRRCHFRVLFRQIVGSLILQALASVALLGLGGYLVIQQQLSLGQLVAAELIVTLVLGSVTKLGKSLESYYDLAAAVDKLGHLIDLPLEREGGESTLPGTKGAALRLRGVTFGYPNHSMVINQLSAALDPGERVALVGPSGCGKSTLVDLLYGLREPAEGHIELDGVDIRDLRLEVLRRNVTTVKNLEVFGGTVVENVRMGRPDISLGDVRAALEDVGLLSSIQALPDGLQTQLATGGAPLSDGQARRLMLARAMAGRPRLLILDESLDDLDPRLRHRIHQALFDRAAPWTLLVVTHSEEVRQRCDREITLSGREVEGPQHDHHAQAARDDAWRKENES